MGPQAETGAEILIVDDTIESLQLLADMLAAHGFEVRAVTSGPAALQAIERAVPELLLLDVTMPEMSGYEVCAHLKARDEFRDMPVIFITALTQVEDKLKGFSVGGSDYITKPYHLEEVLARVSHQIALRRARRELSQRLEELRKLEHLRDDLVHMIVHDMRSPLTVMLSNLELLRGQAAGEEHEMLTEVVQSARSLNAMANALLDVSRLEHGSMPLDRRDCDLAALAIGARDALLALDRTRFIDVAMNGPAVARCDADLIRRVLENLISNGIKHTPAGGRLQVNVERTDARARVSVQDEGPGVPESARARIFEKFGALEQRSARGYHSAGLGLAFCKLAVQAHGGEIGVSSVSPRGSCFWFELPV